MQKINEIISLAYLIREICGDKKGVLSLGVRHVIKLLSSIIIPALIPAAPITPGTVL